MAFKIDDFTAALDKHESLARNNKFQVEIFFPRTTVNLDNIRDIKFMVEQTNLPGIMSHLHETKRYGYGISEKRPMDMVFPEINLTAILTQDSYVHKFFIDWMEFIAPFDTRNGFNGTGAYLYEYKDNYSATVTITTYKTSGAFMFSTTLLEAFPVVVNDLPLAWADHNNKMQLNIQLAYLNWYVDYTNPNITI